MALVHLRWTQTSIQRFYSNILPGNFGGCWIWGKSSDGKGYGMIWVDGRGWSSHKFSYEYHKGKVPEGLELDHLCRVTMCVNPDHLEPVTHGVNISRSPGCIWFKRRAMTHCKRDHPLTPENIYISKLGSRQCLGCKRHHWKVKDYNGKRKRNSVVSKFCGR